MKRLSILVVSLIVLGALSAVSAVPIGKFDVQVTLDPPKIRVVSKTNPDKVAFESDPDVPFLQLREGAFNKKALYEGNDLWDMKSKRLTKTLSLQKHEVKDDIFTIYGEVGGWETEVPFVAVFKELSNNQLGFEIMPVYDMPENIILRLQFVSPKGEGFYGFGEQFSHWNMRGKRFPLLVSEQGVGRGIQPLTWFLNNIRNGEGGSAFTTYSPMPIFITSQMRGMILTNTHPLVVDLKSKTHAALEVWHTSRIQGRLLLEDSPLDLIESISTFTGRMKGLPDWVFNGAVFGIEGGSSVVRPLTNYIRKVGGVPLAGVWMQDWSGLYHFDEGDRLLWNWQLSYDQYPDW